MLIDTNTAVLVFGTFWLPYVLADERWTASATFLSIGRSWSLELSNSGSLLLVQICMSAVFMLLLVCTENAEPRGGVNYGGKLSQGWWLWWKRVFFFFFFCSLKAAISNSVTALFVSVMVFMEQNKGHYPTKWICIGVLKMERLDLSHIYHIWSRRN